MSSLGTATAARAFSLSFASLARCLARGPGRDELGWLGAWPPLAGLADASAERLEALAVAHQECLERAVQPLQARFSLPAAEPEEEARAAAELCAGLAGLAADLGVASEQRPDHVASLFGCLAAMAARRADALEGAEVMRAATIAERAADFADLHLGSWLPALAVGVRLHVEATGGEPFYARLLELSLELLGAWRAGLALPFRAGPPALPLSAARRLAAADTGLRELAASLCAPAESGVFLSRAGMLRLAGVPGGFGSRAQTLHRLLQSARDHDRLPKLLAALRAQLRRAEELLDELAASAPGPALDAWKRRLHNGGELLAGLAAAASSSASSPEEV